MTKKICAVMITIITLFYVIAISFTLKLGVTAKENEYYLTDTEDTYYEFDYYSEAFESGELNFQDAMNGLCEYDLLITHIPLAAYNAVFDAEGNFVAESAPMLKLTFYDEDGSKKRYFINLEEYLTEETKKQIIEAAGEELDSGAWINEVELYCDGDNIIPVALISRHYSDDFELIHHRVELSDTEPNLTLIYGETLDADFDFFAHNLDGKMDKHYEYLKSVAEDYRLQIKEGATVESIETGDNDYPYFLSTGTVSISDFTLNGQKYYFFTAETANHLYSAFSDKEYVKALITLTVVYVLSCAFLCFYGVKLYNKKEEDEKYKDKYTGIV